MELHALLSLFSKSLLFALAAVLPIVNPLATAPVFIQLTRGVDRTERVLLARSIGRHVVLLLVGAMLVGSYVLDFFGVSLPVVRVAGGLVVASMAWNMLGTQQSTGPDQAQMAQSVSASNISIRAFYPLRHYLADAQDSHALLFHDWEAWQPIPIEATQGWCAHHRPWRGSFDIVLWFKGNWTAVCSCKSGYPKKSKH